MNEELFFLNATPSEELLMRIHTRAYWFARIAALCVLLAACAASWPALQSVHTFLSQIGLLRFGLAHTAPAGDADIVSYVMSVMQCGALVALAWGLWMFRVWAWWLALIVSLLLMSGVLFLMPQWVAAVPVLCLMYVLLLPAYAIFAESSVARASTSTCSS